MSQELPDGVELPKPRAWVEVGGGVVYTPDDLRAAILADREKQAARVPEGCPTCKRTDGYVCDWCPSISAPTEPSKPVAPPEREAPSIGQIIEVAESWQRGFMCPLCGHDQPHEHSPREITIYRNGVKWGLKNGTEQWPWKGYPSPSKNAGHDSKGVGRQGGHGTDQHHEHRVGQSGSDRAHDQSTGRRDGIHGACDVSAKVDATPPASAAPSKPEQAEGPSDAELNELARQHTWFNGSHAMTNYPAFARAAIARWVATTPPASAAGEREALEDVRHHISAASLYFANGDAVNGQEILGKAIRLILDVEARMSSAALASKPLPEQVAQDGMQHVATITENMIGNKEVEWLSMEHFERLMKGSRLYVRAARTRGEGGGT